MDRRDIEELVRTGTSTWWRIVKWPLVVIGVLFITLMLIVIGSCLWLSPV